MSTEEQRVIKQNPVPPVDARHSLASTGACLMAAGFSFFNDFVATELRIQIIHSLAPSILTGSTCRDNWDKVLPCPNKENN
jgi:hypothetical protein